MLGAVGEGAQVMQWLELRAETAICALQLGVTEEALKRTAEYTCERKQFGAAIGSFQAVAMQAADAFIDVEAIRSTYWLALYKLEVARMLVPKSAVPSGSRPMPDIALSIVPNTCMAVWVQTWSTRFIASSCGPNTWGLCWAVAVCKLPSWARYWPVTIPSD